MNFDITLNPVFFWIALIIIFLLIEMATVGLTSIWLAGGSLVGLIVCFLGGSFWVQIIAALVAAFALLSVTRPFVKKVINPRRVRTNYEEAIGKKVRVTERVDNITETGTAIFNGQEWSARMESDEASLEPDEMAEVVRVEGVKLILRPTGDQSWSRS